MVEERHLAFKAKHRAVNPRQAEQRTRIIDQVAGRQVIGSVNDDIPAFQEFHGIVWMEAGLHYFNLNSWINAVECCSKQTLPWPCPHLRLREEFDVGGC